MKTKLTGKWLAGGLALVMPWLHGCAQDAQSATGGADTNQVPASTLTNSVPEALPSPGDTNAPGDFPVPPDPLAHPHPPAPAAAAPTELVLPPGLNMSPSYAEVVRMTRAGVDDRTITAFISNSAGTFNMGADEIIYLKDLGLPHEVIAAMIEHDHAISSGAFTVRASTVPSRTYAAPAPAAPETAAAPAPPGTPPVTTAPLEPSVWQPGEAGEAPAYAPAFDNAPPAPQPAAEMSHEFFQESLAPYGNWVEVDGYGTVWQPNVTIIDTTWRPYLNGGRWLYTQAGWYWASDYAWGFTFQYGRWFFAPARGWCWWPNTVWGPSWVTWRSSPGFCGWAPLPPFTGWTTGVGLTWFGSGVSVGFGFNFGWSQFNWVPIAGICSPVPWRHCVPANQAVAIYDRSVVVNNIIVGDNNTIINRGLDVDQVSRYAGRPVPRGEIRDTPVTADSGMRGDRISRVGDRTIIERASQPAGRGPGSSPSRAAALASTSATPEGSGVGSRPLPPRPGATEIRTSATTPAASAAPPGATARAASGRGPGGTDARAATTAAASATPPTANRFAGTTAMQRADAANPTATTGTPGSVARPPRPSTANPAITATAPTANPAARTVTPQVARPLPPRPATGVTQPGAVSTPPPQRSPVVIGGGNNARPPTARTITPSPTPGFTQAAPPATAISRQPIAPVTRPITPTPQPVARPMQQMPIAPTPAPVTAPRTFTAPSQVPAPVARPTYASPPVAQRPANVTSFTPAPSHPTFTAPSYSARAPMTQSAPAMRGAPAQAAPSSGWRPSR